MLGCEPTASGCLRAFVGRFGKLAYRRPLETAELDSVVNRATADALDATDQFRFAIEVLLSSSNFLYRVEVGNAADAVATLTPHRAGVAPLVRAVGARARRDAARSGGVDAGDARRSRDAGDDDAGGRRAKTFYDAFFRQWLGFEGMQAPPNPPAGWTDALVTGHGARDAAGRSATSPGAAAPTS